MGKESTCIVYCWALNHYKQHYVSVNLRIRCNYCSAGGSPRNERQWAMILLTRSHGCVLPQDALVWQTAYQVDLFIVPLTAESQRMWCLEGEISQDNVHWCGPTIGDPFCAFASGMASPGGRKKKKRETERERSEGERGRKMESEKLPTDGMQARGFVVPFGPLFSLTVLFLSFFPFLFFFSLIHSCP